MISCDTNVLLIALEASRPLHTRARSFLDSHRHDPEFAICELALMELYVLLRNPAVARRALGAAAAVALIESLRGNPCWDVLDYPGPAAGIMGELWRVAATPDFPRRRVFDARLAMTLLHHGVTEFATTNVKDFEGLGFTRVWNPLT